MRSPAVLLDAHAQAHQWVHHVASADFDLAFVGPSTTYLFEPQCMMD